MASFLVTKNGYTDGYKRKNGYIFHYFATDCNRSRLRQKPL